MSQERIFLFVAVVASAIFLVQFLMSIFAGDLDVDMDADTDAGIDLGSFVSFKGLVHFLIGFGWYMYLAGTGSAGHYLVGVLVGLVFMLVLWYLYRVAMKLQQDNKTESDTTLVGRECTIYFNKGEGRYLVQVQINGALRERAVVSEQQSTYATGDKTTISRCENGTLFIH